MENNVKSEFDLYPAMCKWLKVHLEDKYKNKKSEVVVVDCHSVYLDSILEKYDVIKYYPQVVGLKIQIDVLGIAILEDKANIYFIEAKKTALNLPFSSVYLCSQMLPDRIVFEEIIKK